LPAPETVLQAETARLAASTARMMILRMSGISRGWNFAAWQRFTRRPGSPATDAVGGRRREDQPRGDAALGVADQFGAAAQLAGEGGHQGAADAGGGQRVVRRRAVVADLQFALLAAHREVDGQLAAALGEGVLLGVGDRLRGEQRQGLQAVRVDHQRVHLQLGPHRMAMAQVAGDQLGGEFPRGTAAGPPASGPAPGRRRGR
jgi:hypothetical protein